MLKLYQCEKCIKYFDSDDIIEKHHFTGDITYICRGCHLTEKE